jgi:L,D-peptidoglycan transpeptidase YkuD (ErfK/YbiS/YcfS/YnhG family)
MKLMALLLAPAFVVALNAQAAPADVFAGARQLLVVTTPAPDAIDGKLQRYARSRADQPWQVVGDAVPVVVGRSGLAWGSSLIPASAPDLVKKEGDGRSPEGVFALGTSFGYAAAALQGARLPYLSLTANTECVDDPASQHYNRVLGRSAVAPDWNSSERMRNMGESYRWGIVVDHNHIAAPATGPKPVAGGGSCIFLHVWKGPGKGTAGCTAMAQSDIESLLTWLDPDRQPLLVQLTAVNYLRLHGEWQLPQVAGQPQ